MLQKHTMPYNVQKTTEFKKKVEVGYIHNQKYPYFGTKLANLLLSLSALAWWR